MNYKQALEASNHDPKGVNKVLEGLEWECNKCKGGKILISRGCSDCNNTGKIHYSWQPRVGEWVITPCVLNKNEPVLITCVDEIGFHYATENAEDFCSMQTYGRCIPIFEWEVIEEILEKTIDSKGRAMQYKLDTRKRWMEQNRVEYVAIIRYRGDVIVEKVNTSRISAVYEAILALEKELK